MACRPSNCMMSEIDQRSQGRRRRHDSCVVRSRVVRLLANRQWTICYGVSGLGLVASLISFRRRGRNLKELSVPVLIATVLWPWIEYVSHRFVLHVAISKLHQAHHESPHKPRFLHVPFVVPLGFFLFTAGLTWCLRLASLEAFFVWNATMLLWFETFEITHKYAHHRSASWLIIKRARAFHLRHHTNGATNFGFTTTFPDWCCGTMHPEDQRHYSSSLRLLLGAFPLLAFAF